MERIKRIKEKIGGYVAVESIKQFRWRDLLVIVGMALVWLGGSVLFKDNGFRYPVMLLVLGTLMAAALFAVRKTGTALLLVTLCSLVTPSFDEMGIGGVQRLMVFVLAGMIFEGIFLLFKLEFKNLPLDVTLGTAFSMASIPVSTTLLLSPLTFLDRFIPVLNLGLLAFFLGLFGAGIAFIGWYQVRTTKWFLRFEYG